MIDRIFRSAQIKEQAYNPCLSVLNPSKSYTPERLELACRMAIDRIVHNAAWIFAGAKNMRELAAKIDLDQNRQGSNPRNVNKSPTYPHMQG